MSTRDVESVTRKYAAPSATSIRPKPVVVVRLHATSPTAMGRATLRALSATRAPGPVPLDNATATEPAASTKPAMPPSARRARVGAGDRVGPTRRGAPRGWAAATPPPHVLVVPGTSMQVTLKPRPAVPRRCRAERSAARPPTQSRSIARNAVWEQRSRVRDLTRATQEGRGNRLVAAPKRASFQAMVPPSSNLRRRALVSVVLAVVAVLVCSGLLAATVLVPAPPAVLPLAIVAAIACPMLAAWELRGSLGALREQEMHPITKWRRTLDRLPETKHPLGF